MVEQLNVKGSDINAKNIRGDAPFKYSEFHRKMADLLRKLETRLK